MKQRILGTLISWCNLSGGAWIAGEVDDRQFIEVDLGFVQPVYGVVTKGRHGHPEWVKSYKVLYSRDGNAYAYVTEDGSNPQVKFVATESCYLTVDYISKQSKTSKFVKNRFNSESSGNF